MYSSIDPSSQSLGHYADNNLGPLCNQQAPWCRSLPTTSDRNRQCIPQSAPSGEAGTSTASKALGAWQVSTTYITGFSHCASCRTQDQAIRRYFQIQMSRFRSLSSRVYFSFLWVNCRTTLAEFEGNNPAVDDLDEVRNRIEHFI